MMGVFGKTSCTVFLLLLSFPQAKALQEVCDLRIVVLDPESRPMSGVPGRVIFEGNVIAEAQSVNGHLDFCDIGDKTVSVVVGLNVCGQVTLNYISIPEIRKPLRVIYQICHAQFYFFGCNVLVRAKDASGQPVQGATVRIGPGYEDKETDRFGRARIELNWNVKYSIIISKGSDTAELSVNCTRQRKTFTEEIVTLGAK